jgi:hypothetical protein
MSARNDPETDAKLYWVLVAAYILRALGKLPAGIERQLDEHTSAAGAPDWKVVVERELQIDSDFVKRLHDCCTDRMEENRAILFMLRGFGCPDPVDRLQEVLS